MFSKKYKLEVDGMCYERSTSYSLGYVQQMKERLISEGANSINIYCNDKKMSGLCHPNPFNKMTNK